MEYIFYWVLLLFVSLIASISDVMYKIGSTIEFEAESWSVRSFIRNRLIVISWVCLIFAKFLVGIPYTAINLSLAVPINNTMVAFFGSLLGLIVLKEKPTKNLLIAWTLTILSCFFIIIGETS